MRTSRSGNVCSVIRISHLASTRSSPISKVEAFRLRSPTNTKLTLLFGSTDDASLSPLMLGARSPLWNATKDASAQLAPPPICHSMVSRAVPIAAHGAGVHNQRNCHASLVYDAEAVSPAGDRIESCTCSSLPTSRLHPMISGCHGGSRTLSLRYALAALPTWPSGKMMVAEKTKSYTAPAVSMAAGSERVDAFRSSSCHPIGTSSSSADAASCSM